MLLVLIFLTKIRRFSSGQSRSPVPGLLGPSLPRAGATPPPDLLRRLCGRSGSGGPARSGDQLGFSLSQRRSREKGDPEGSGGGCDGSADSAQSEGLPADLRNTPGILPSPSAH